MRGVLHIIWAFVWRLSLVGAVVVAIATGYYVSILPSPDELFDGRQRGSVILRDVDGDIFAWRGEQYGGKLRAGSASPHLVHAIIAVEDKRFNWHPGLDPIGIARAFMVNIRAGRIVQGGSTITQQVARLLYLSNDRNIIRKLKEVPIAFALELKYTKEQILSIYMNRVYLGAGTHGFEAAAQRYFGKSARVVDISEAAMLAGLLRAPTRYAPTTNLAGAQARASVITRLMEGQGYITEAEEQYALAHPAVLGDGAAPQTGGAFADWVMERGAEDRFLYLLKGADVGIRTTFDPEIQKAAEAAVAEVFEEKVMEGSDAEVAVVVMTRDGAVRAMIGGRDNGSGLFNRATQALRQTGSAFKPIVYAAGLESGLSPLDVIVDKPITIGDWSPQNYSNSYRGAVTLTEALADSINTVAVRVAKRAGFDHVRKMARRLGLDGALAEGPAVALGASAVRLTDLTGVYATIANGGRLATPHGVIAIRLRGRDQSIMSGAGGQGKRVLSEHVAGLLTGMMMDVVQKGTGGAARLAGREVAGKTGTSDKARDAWFLGFTADYVVGVWMGYDDNRPLTNVTGGGLPADVWHEVMVRIEKGHPPRPLNAIEPEPTRIVRGPESTPAGNSDRRDAPEEDGLLGRIVSDVAHALGADPAPAKDDWDPVAGNER